MVSENNIMNINGINFMTLYSVKAHLFEFESKSIKNWIQKSNHPISISIIERTVDNQANSLTLIKPNFNKRELKIVGIDDNNHKLLDTNILPDTNFQRKSANFTQWIDNTKTLHGLAFSSKDDLDQFYETFKELQYKLSEQSFTLSHTQLPPLQQPRVRQPQTMQQQHLPSSSSAIATIGMITNNMQSNSQIGNETIWNQQQQLQPSNLITEPIVNQSSKSIRNSLSGTTASINKHKYNSNSPSHSGHQLKRLQHQQILSNNINLSLNGDISNVNNSSCENEFININNSPYPKNQIILIAQEQTIGNCGITDTNIIRTDNSSSRGIGGTRISTNVIGRSDSANLGGRQLNQDEIINQLKYENERLKQSLEENSKITEVCQSELITLKEENLKLTQALHESGLHIEEWKSGLSKLEEENDSLKFRISTMQSENNNIDYKKELQKYKNFVDGVQSKLKKKEMEIEELQKSMEVLEKLKAQQPEQSNDNNNHSSKVDKQKLEVINAKFDAKMVELTNVQKDFRQLLEKLNS